MNACRNLIAALAIVVGIWPVTPANAVTLLFSGTYNNLGAQPIFGQSGAILPFSFEITFDPALDTNTTFFPTGYSFSGGGTATHPWYGYSASSITAASLTFGTQTWQVADISPISVGGISADFWFDTDISIATPTRTLMFFYDSADGAYLEVGNMIPAYSFIADFSTTAGQSSDMSISVVSAVPEPAVWTMLIVAFTLLGAQLRRQRHRILYA